MYKKILTLIMVSWFFCNCSTEPGKSTLTLADTIAAHEIADSIINEGMHNAMLDTVGVSNAPVKILSAQPVKNEYSNYRNVSLKYKNVSNKTISAIKFSWYGENAFGEPADMGMVDGFGNGNTDRTLKAGKTSSGEWQALSKDVKKIIIAWPREVVFEDGTKWKSSN